jgi:hypothetical protein
MSRTAFDVLWEYGRLVREREQLDGRLEEIEASLFTRVPSICAALSASRSRCLVAGDYLFRGFPPSETDEPVSRFEVQDCESAIDVVLPDPPALPAEPEAPATVWALGDETQGLGPRWKLLRHIDGGHVRWEHYDGDFRPLGAERWLTTFPSEAEAQAWLEAEMVRAREDACLALLGRLQSFAPVKIPRPAEDEADEAEAIPAARLAQIAEGNGAAVPL